MDSANLLLDEQGYKIHPQHKDSLVLSETYEDVKKMLYRLSWKMVSKCGGEFDDWLSIANKIFVEAYLDYDATKGSQFSTWVYNRVSYAFWDFITDNKKYQDRFGESNQLLAESSDSKPHRLDGILKELSEDAKTIVQLIIDTPGDLVSIIRVKKPEKQRRAIWKYLRGLGVEWSLGRVVNSFDEIREVVGT